MKTTFTLLIALAFPAVMKAQDTIVLQMDPSGKDAALANCVPCGYNNSNFGNAVELGAIAWTNGGNPSNMRGVFQFFFPQAVYERGIQSATLSLYHTPTTNNVGHSTSSGSNVSYLERITTPWQENTVTWDTQPTTTATNRVTLPASTSSTQDYPEIDVTQLVADMLADSANSHGFMLRLETESYYRSLKFGSGDEPDPANRPRLTLVISAVSVNEIESIASISIYPNPSQGVFTVYAEQAGASEGMIMVHNMLGETVYSKQISPSNGVVKESIDLSGNAKGIYFAEYTSGGKKIVKKIVLN